jgi:ubiquitin-protein ligase
MRPPVVRFITRIFHPNISRHGDVGLDSIHHNWSLALTISKVLISIQSLLTDPYCHVCMEPEIGRVYFSQRAEFERLAKLWTWNYAMHDYLTPMPIKLR